MPATAAVSVVLNTRNEHPGTGPAGIYSQLNRAIRRVRHPWYTYASGNDRALPTKLRDEVRLCQARGKLVCYSSYLVTDGALRVVRQASFPD